ncbi:MAG: NADPH-dependent glutamate synthase [Methanolinea sp.]|nr:NADPH-dependent glutamate synthase [Methanolinea sp.]
MAERPAGERVKDFDEVDTGLSEEEAVAEAERCLQCTKPSCVKGCPVEIDIPAFIARVAERDFHGAASVIRENNILPAICGRVCPQEVQCEGQCILGAKGTPVRIGALERFVADRERESGIPVPRVDEPTGKRVAVVGSGPAGITAAAELARMGHAVTVYESLHEPGGVLVYGIPEFRLPKDVVRAEIDLLRRMGVTILTNHVAGSSVTVDDLLSHDAVFIGTGAGLPYFMGIPGENLPGVYSANEFLTRVNLMRADRFPEYDTPVRHAGRVVVVGGGNVAMDAARVARRLGARTTLVYRRRREDLPARQVEVRRAEEEGVEFIFCASPVRLLGDGCVEGVVCQRMEMCPTGGSGRPEPVPVEGSLFTIDADMCIVAIGQGPNPLLVRMLPGISRGERGNVLVDDEGRTAHPKVFAAGDIATGAATVILAMGGAKRAARAMDRMLRRK